MSAAVWPESQITRCAERAARRVNVRYFQPVRLEKSSGKTSNARSWIVTTPMQGRASGRKQLEAIGVNLIGGPPERLTDYLSAERKKWLPLVKRLGIKAY